MKKIGLLGATGSIGIQTLDVIREHSDQFQLTSLSFGTNVEKAVPIIKEFNPTFVVVKDNQTKKELRAYFPSLPIEIGKEGMVQIAKDDQTDVLVNAVMGSIGLEPTLEAIRSNKTIAIANKETLVTAGHLVMEETNLRNVSILPVDSEHSAIFQCLQGENPKSISRLLLTASGGSFRDLTRRQLEDVTVERALQHPNWSMGAKITIDSATMMNKGLEVIEAHWLFSVPYEQIDVLLHRESIIHSMVEFKDRSVIAQLGTPDMRIPIQYALSYPERLSFQQSEPLDLLKAGKLHFEQMSFERFPCLKLAFEAGKVGGTMTTVLNAANEEAVSQFLQHKITFLQIEELIEKALEQHSSIKHPSLDTILQVDEETRRRVQSFLT